MQALDILKCRHHPAADAIGGKLPDSPKTWRNKHPEPARTPPRDFMPSAECLRVVL
jgi:hypothetical protein